MNSHLIYAYEIPDDTRPIAKADRGMCGASGVLVPFVPRQLAAQDVAGRTITRISDHVGTYGMGGAGFFGFELGHEWLVVAIWGAGCWMTFAGRSVGDDFWDESGRPLPWMGEHGDDLSARVVGQSIVSITVAQHGLDLLISSGEAFHIDPSPAERPILQGSGEPRAFLESDDLRKAVFLAPTDEIWG